MKSPSTLGWILTGVITLVLVKTLGVAGGLITILAYYWLQPRIGTFFGIACSAVLGIVVGVGLTLLLANKQRTDIAPLAAEPEREKSTSSSSANPAKSNQATGEASDWNKGSWTYSQKTNAMTGGVANYATALGNATGQFQDPGILELRQSQEQGDMVSVETSTWPLCYKPTCSLMVRFDDEKPMEFPVIVSSEYEQGGRRVAIKDHVKFSNALASSKRVRISRSDFTPGSHFMEFDVTSLDKGKVGIPFN